MNGNQVINVSMVPGGILPVAHISQYDTARVINLAYDDEIQSMASVSVKGTRPDGGTVTQAASHDASARSVRWTPSADFTAIAGDVRAEMVFLTSGGRVGSGNFILRVEKAGAATDGPVVGSSVRLTEAGTYNVSPYAEAIVDIQRGGIGTKEITENGVYSVLDFEKVDVDVPGIVPTGTKEIVNNGNYDITEYERVHVDVPQGGAVGGTITITENGEQINVAQYRYANVRVDGGVCPVPSATKQITENGSYDVLNYARAVVNVPGGISEIKDIFDGTKSDSSVTVDISDVHYSRLRSKSFYQAKSLGEITVDAAIIDTDCFRGSGLAKVTIKGCTRLESGSFYGCLSLAEMHFTDISEVPVMADAEVLDSTVIDYGNGVIYFPTAELVEAAKHATNWSLFSQMIQLESS